MTQKCMIESNISPTDCVQEYPVIDSVQPKLLKRIPQSQRPEDWPQTWCKDATYSMENIENWY